MIPKLHAKGKSFKGAALYLLHDKGSSQSSERVEWTSVRNFVTDDPNTAWKIMVATSYSQDRLKEEAGIKSSGRKSKDHVLHLSLSWHPDEADGLDRNEMMRAAVGAIRALGADDHQALVICHNDEKQPHVHLIINRISPDDGRILSSSKEKEKLSRWAQAYEEERGQILCNERVLNNAARDRGEFTRGAKDTPRHMLELEQAARNTVNKESADELSKAQRAKDHEVARKARDIKARHRSEWDDLYADFKARIVSIEKAGDKVVATRIKSIRESYHPKWETLERKHRQEINEFADREESVFGRVENAFRGLDLKEMIRNGNPTNTFRNLFGAFSSSGARLEAMKRKQQKERQALEREQKSKERLAKAEEMRLTNQKKSYERKQLFSLRADLILKQKMDKAYIRTSWRKRDADRRESWAKLVQSQNYKQEFNRVAKPEQDSARDTKQSDYDYYKQLADEINRSGTSLSKGFDRGR